MKSIEELIRLTPEQELLCREMEALYQKMEAAGIAFAYEWDMAKLVAYNATGIAGCAPRPSLCSEPKGYEEVFPEDMRSLFQVWVGDTLCVKRKTENDYED